MSDEKDFKAGFVAVIGRPNVGKSTLMNTLLGQKLSITSPKPQTTRHRIHGIHSTENYQIVFVDTPGMHLGGQKSINRYMNRAANSAFADVDVVLFVVEAGRWTQEDQAVAQKCQNLDIPVIVLVNKIDKMQQKEVLLPYLQKIAEKIDFDEVIPVSAYKKSGIELIEAEVLKHLPNQPAIFPEDYITDRSSRFLASEIVREKLMRTLGDEVPYGVTVEIEKFKFDEEEGRWVIHALILVERPGQKQIVIGKQGQLIKQVGIQARKDLMKMMDSRVHLELWVKVKENWADDDRALASLGYTDEIN
ncbi:GTPase Era [Hydrogenovibrio marinus]|uniref:GTPase Era n=1 Tax=Hydrogenovibrio marinus TaxID=28885 RepID=A0A066ZXG7_HYDMR|nr:GTPase Era [Hydrogenovibrio marinus]KDN94785.1 GTPase Era [Hydrogenovibrio marinus]BBN59243.1 GTPase Era [Hydrogenovibrio marinus]